MTTKTPKEASRLAQYDNTHCSSSGTELVDQELPTNPTLSLVEFSQVTVDKYTSEQIRAMYLEQLNRKAS